MSATAPWKRVEAKRLERYLVARSPLEKIRCAGSARRGYEWPLEWQGLEAGPTTPIQDLVTSPSSLPSQVGNRWGGPIEWVGPPLGQALRPQQWKGAECGNPYRPRNDLAAREPEFHRPQVESVRLPRSFQHLQRACPNRSDSPMW